MTDTKNMSFADLVKAMNRLEEERNRKTKVPTEKRNVQTKT